MVDSELRLMEKNHAMGHERGGCYMTLHPGGSSSVVYPARNSADRPLDRRRSSLVHKHFVRAVQSSGTYDGYDFGRLYSVHEQRGRFFLAKSTADTPFTGITSCHRAVIDALLTEKTERTRKSTLTIRSTGSTLDSVALGSGRAVIKKGSVGTDD